MSDIFIPQVTPTPSPAPTPKPLIDMISGVMFDYVIPLTIVVIFAVITGFILYKLYKKKLSKRKTELVNFKDFDIGKYAIKFYRNFGGKYVEVDSTKLDINKTGFRYHNKDFSLFKREEIAFSDRNNNFYAFDMDTGKQLTFNKIDTDNKVSLDDIDTYVNRGIIEQIVKGLEDLKPKGQWLMLICGLALGLGIGIVIGIYVM